MRPGSTTRRARRPCSPEQMGAIEARLGIHEGELIDSTPKEKETFDIGNANILAL